MPAHVALCAIGADQRRQGAKAALAGAHIFHEEQLDVAVCDALDLEICTGETTMSVPQFATACTPSAQVVDLPDKAACRCCAAARLASATCDVACKWAVKGIHACSLGFPDRLNPDIAGYIACKHNGHTWWPPRHHCCPPCLLYHRRPHPVQPLPVPGRQSIMMDCPALLACHGAQAERCGCLQSTHLMLDEICRLMAPDSVGTCTRNHIVRDKPLAAPLDPSAVGSS